MVKLRTKLVAGLCALPLLVGAAEPVNINTADAATLAAAIKGVGQARAEAIVAYRTKHGPFATVDDLALVSGVGARLVQSNREQLTVGAEAR